VWLAPCPKSRPVLNLAVEHRYIGVPLSYATRGGRAGSANDHTVATRLVQRCRLLFEGLGPMISTVDQHRVGGRVGSGQQVPAARMASYLGIVTAEPSLGRAGT